MTTVVKNNLTAYNNDPKNWAPNSIGADFSVGSISLQQTAPQQQGADINATDNTYGAPDPAFKPGETKVNNPTAKRTGLPDKRFKDRGSVQSASPGGAKGLAIASIAIDLAIVGTNLYIQNRIEKDEGLINKHIGSFKLAASDVNYALSKGLIPKEFQTQERLSDIVNVVLSGNSFLNSIGDEAGAKILEIGKNIYNTLSTKRKEYTGRLIETSKLDGIPNKIQERNANYDAQYVKENPPLGEPPKQ